MFAAYAQQMTNARNPFGGFGVRDKNSSGFGLSNFGNKLKEMGTKTLNSFVSNKIEKGISNLAQTTGVGDLIGKDNVQKGIDMLKGSLGNIF